MKCNFCDETNEDLFYSSNKTKCKKCIKEAVNKRRIEKSEQIKEYDRNRKNAKERVEQNKNRIEKYKKENNSKYLDYITQKNEWAKRNKQKRNAHLKVQRALFKGVIKRPTNCENCNSSEELEAHHNDYSKPLIVEWLCIECHNKKHIELNKQKRANNG